MNKIIALVAAILSTAISKEYEVGRLEYKTWNNYSKTMLDQEARITYDTETGELLTYCEYILGEFVFTFDKDNIQKVNSLISKYARWNKKASKEKVEIQKKLEDIKILTSGWSRSKQWYLAEPYNVDVMFISKNENEHNLTMVFPVIKNLNNQYETYKPDDMYINYKQAVYLLRLINQDNLKKLKEKIEKQRRLEAEFN